MDLTPVKEAEVRALEGVTELNAAALSNMAPRIRMLTLYAVAAAENRLVAGTGNRSEAYVGYFTKWGDGAHDFNPIADLTVTEIYEFLRYLKAPSCVIEKPPCKEALFDGQTDESEMGDHVCGTGTPISWVKRFRMIKRKLQIVCTVKVNIKEVISSVSTADKVLSRRQRAGFLFPVTSADVFFSRLRR